MRATVDDLVEEQLEFYRTDAAAYEAWRVEVFERGGGGEKGAALRRDEKRVLGALGRFAPRGRVLELAAGTGRYTATLLAAAKHVTAVDASPESLGIARSKLAQHAAAERLAWVEADLFRWQPQHRYDCVFFAYWLSHVPPERLDDFWRLVGDALAPGGRVFFVDSAGGPRLASPSLSGQPTYQELDDVDPHVGVRELAGRRYRVVRVVREPRQLESQLHAFGWSACVERGELALWGNATRHGEG
jgi:SAM-dependent methyltransferase